jgi:hypothetical protein
MGQFRSISVRIKAEFYSYNNNETPLYRLFNITLRQI